MPTNKTGYFKQNPALLRRGGQANQDRLRLRAPAQQAPGANLPPNVLALQEALRAIAANNPMNPGTLPDIPTLNQELQNRMGGQSPMPPPLQEMQRQELQGILDNMQLMPALPSPQPSPGGSIQDLLRRQDIQRDLDSRISANRPPVGYPGVDPGHDATITGWDGTSFNPTPTPMPSTPGIMEPSVPQYSAENPPPGVTSEEYQAEMDRRLAGLNLRLPELMEAMGGIYSPPVPSMSYPGDTPASIMPQLPPNLPGTGTAMVPPMPSAPPPARLPQEAIMARPGMLQYDQLQRMAQAPAAPPSRPQPWRPQGQRPAPATVGQTTTNPALQDRDRQRGGQSMARPAPQRGGLGIGELGMESAGPQRQGTGFMSGDLAWTTPQRPSGPSYYEGLMPGSTYSPMEQQRRR